MLPQIETLLLLQDRDQRIRRLKLEQKAIPLERQSIEEKLAAANATAEKVKAEAQHLEVERKNLELDIQSKQATIVKYKTQQFQTRKNEEFQALSNEIKRFEKEIVGVEDRELELMEQAESMKVRLAEADKVAAAARASVKQQLEDLTAKEQAVASQLAEAEAERATMAAKVPEDLLDRYQRLLTSKGDAAIVPLNHEVCMGCHMKVTTQTVWQVKAEQDVVHCGQCGRILYYGDV